MSAVNSPTNPPPQLQPHFPSPPPNIWVTYHFHFESLPSQTPLSLHRYSPSEPGQLGQTMHSATYPLVNKVPLERDSWLRTRVTPLATCDCKSPILARVFSTKLFIIWEAVASGIRARGSLCPHSPGRCSPTCPREK